MQIAHGGPCGQHVLNSPRLTAHFGYYPARLATYIAQRNQHDSHDKQPTPLGIADILAPRHVSYNEEEQDKQTSQAHHDSESPEVYGDIGYYLIGVFHVTITEILYIVGHGLTHFLALVAIAVLLQSRDGLLPHRYLFFQRGLSLS